MKKIILTSLLLAPLLTFSQNDTIKAVDALPMTEDIESMQEMVIEFKRKIQLKQKAGKYEIELEGTNFKQFADTWEGMKNIPLLQTSDNEALKINGKTAIVEINGIRTELSAADLENYIRSLNPETVKKIELITNPGAMYDSAVGAVVNIVLKEQEQQYRITASENAGMRKNPFSYTNLNYSQNFKKLYLSTNYNFGYNTINSTSNTNIYTQKNGLMAP